MTKWQLPEHWEWKRLDDPSVSEIIMGQSPPGNTYNDHGQGLPFFQGKTDFGEYYPTVTKWCTDPRKITLPGDVLISVRAPVGPTNLTRERSIIGRGLAAIRPTGGVETKYLLYVLRRREDYIASKGKGSTFSNISKTSLSETEIPIPDIDVQHRIVARIEALFTEVREMRELQQNITSDTERLRQAVINDAFRHGIEAGWVWKTIDDLIDGKPQYGTSQKANTDGIGVPVLRMGNIQDGELSFDDMKHVELPDTEREKYLLSSGDLLFNRSNGSIDLVGKTAVFRSDIQMVFASYLIRIVPDQRFAVPEYLSAYVNSDYGREYIVSRAVRSTGQANVNATKLRAMPIPVPDQLSEQKRLVAHIHNAMNEIREMQQLNLAENQRIEDLERAILTAAFRGEL